MRGIVGKVAGEEPVPEIHQNAVIAEEKSPKKVVTPKKDEVKEEEAV